jgi:hypothetical protein
MKKFTRDAETAPADAPFGGETARGRCSRSKHENRILGESRRTKEINPTFTFSYRKSFPSAAVANTELALAGRIDNRFHLAAGKEPREGRRISEFRKE